MTTDEFNEWLRELGLSKSEAARRLGMTRKHVQRLSQGYPISRVIELACERLREGGE